jgi:ABC-type branched-subunit amino acid transport system permease subunit
MKLAIALVAALALAALPLLTSSNYVIGVGISALIFTVAAAALNLIYGFTGLLSFAQLGFWGIGGYVTALTVVTFGGNFWWGVVWAALLNAVVALAIGYPTLRTNRHAFVIMTLTFALLVTLIARDWVDLTRGPLGIPNLPKPSAFGYHFGTTGQYYWVAWAFSVAMLGFLTRSAARASAAPWSPSSRTSRWCAPRASRRCPTSSRPSPSVRRSPVLRAASSPSTSASSIRCSSTSIICRPS